MAALAMTVTDDGRNWWRTAPPGWTSAQILFFAVGTGTTTPTSSDHKLMTEVYRAAFQSALNGTNVGESHMYGFIDLAFANGNALAECGLFASSQSATATSSANTGVLIARGLLTPAINKVNTMTVTLDFDITFS